MVEVLERPIILVDPPEVEEWPPQEVQVVVTDRHIGIGISGDPNLCPIATALTEMRQGVGWWIVSTIIVTYVNLDGMCTEYKLPPEAMKFIEVVDEEDKENPAQPLEFVMVKGDRQKYMYPDWEIMKHLEPRDMARYLSGGDDEE